MYLNCHSYFSLRYGTFSVEELVKNAAEFGIRKLALTDINNTSGVFEFVRLCHENNIIPCVGVEVRSNNKLLYICLAENPYGFSEINSFLSDYLLAKRPFPRRPPNFKNSFVIYPLAELIESNEFTDREYVGVTVSELNQLWHFRKKLNLRKFVCLQPITFRDKLYFNLHRLLRSIDLNCLLSKLPISAQASANEVFYSPAQMQEIFGQHAYLLRNAMDLLDRCHFEFDFNLPKNKRVFTTSRKDDIELLRKLADDGLYYRYGNNQTQAKERVEKELKVIDELDFSSYFLITWDIVKYARSRGYFHVGRGSGANSIVAYCVGITDVDPIELDLFFERFINQHRTSPPDFDIDFSWDERDEVIQYVFKRYGSDFVCLLATYVTFKGSSIIREMAKVFGLPKSEIDDWIDNFNRPPSHQYAHLILRYGALMENFPNYLSIHAGGILISEQPLYAYTALSPMPKGFPICQFDMYVAEDIGFAKFDVLSQRGLGHIKEAVDIIRKNRGIAVDIHAVQNFKKDEKIKQQLLKHETMGCFYIESPAMRQLIWKLKCENYLSLVAASSIIRPGVASSGMMREYIRRHINPSSFQPLHPKIGELLHDTYSIMIYQEDVIKVAHFFAGLTLAEADVLRRGMSGKGRKKAEFKFIEDKFFKNCASFGYEESIVQELWRQIESFAGYSFSKAHSASFAVESYQSLFLKSYYPLEFMVAVINNFGGFYRTEMYIHEARRWGAVIEAPDINESMYLTSIVDKTVWLGWVHLKNLEKKTVSGILEQRKLRKFDSFEDFVKRVPIGLDQLTVLIRIGAFRSFELGKKELLWEAHLRVNNKIEFVYTGELFTSHTTEQQFALPVFSTDPIEDAYDQLEILGFPINSPFSLVENLPENTLSARDLIQSIGRSARMVGYYTNHKSIRTKKGEKMYFGYFIDQNGEFFDTVHFPNTVTGNIFYGIGVYLLEGKVSIEFGFPSLETKTIIKLPYRSDPRIID